MQTENKTALKTLWDRLPELGPETVPEFVECLKSDIVSYAPTDKISLKTCLSYILHSIANTTLSLYYAARRRLGLAFIPHRIMIDQSQIELMIDDIRFHLTLNTSYDNKIVFCVESYLFSESTNKRIYQCEKLSSLSDLFPDYLEFIFSNLPAASPTLLIGVDYGGVCSLQDIKYEDGTYSGELEINVPDCLETLHALKKAGHRLVLISFCGSKRATETRKYLATIDHPFEELYFVKDRTYKKLVCQRLGVDVMIDDRLDVLETLEPTQTVHFGQGHVTDSQSTFKPTFSAPTWKDVLSMNLTSANLKPDASVDLSRKLYV